MFEETEMVNEGAGSGPLLREKNAIEKYLCSILDIPSSYPAILNHHLVAIDLWRRQRSPVINCRPLSVATLPLFILLIPLLIPTVILTVQLVDATSHVLYVLGLVLQAAVIMIGLHTGFDLTANSGSQLGTQGTFHSLPPLDFLDDRFDVKVPKFSP